MDGWKDIISAPRDGTPILAAWDRGGGDWAAAVMWSQSGAFGVNVGDGWREVRDQPTHWRPLPDPPV